MQVAITKQGSRHLLPAGWEDAGPSAWSILRALARRAPGAGKLEAIRIMTGFNRRQFNSLDPEEVATLAMAFDWLEGGMRTPIRNHFLLGLRWYHWPEPDFLDGQAMAYALADQHFEAYLAAETPADRAASALELLATLVRPRKGNSLAPLTSVEEVEEQARRFRSLGPEWSLQALLYWIAVRNTFDELYGDYLFRPSEFDQAPAVKVPTFGWWSQFRFVAGEGVFGSVAHVEQANMHEVCQYLVEKEGIRRANQFEMEKFKAKHD